MGIVIQAVLVTDLRVPFYVGRSEDTTSVDPCRELLAGSSFVKYLITRVVYWAVRWQGYSL